MVKWVNGAWMDKRVAGDEAEWGKALVLRGMLCDTTNDGVWTGLEKAENKNNSFYGFDRCSLPHFLKLRLAFVCRWSLPRQCRGVQVVQARRRDWFPIKSK